MSVDKPQVVAPDDCFKIHFSLCICREYIWVRVGGKELLTSYIDWMGKGDKQCHAQGLLYK